jgi:hypothetical protein
LAACGIDNNSSKVFNRQIQFQYSPDKRCSVEIYEAGLDSIDCSTQVIVNFKNTGAGIYSVNGINRGIKAYWKDNSTIVIETFKKYEATQKMPQIQSFSDIVKVEYIEN